MRGEKKNGLPKSASVGNIQANPRGDHEKVVDGCFKDRSRFELLIQNSTCPKILAYAKQKIEKEIADPAERAQLLPWVNIRGSLIIKKMAVYKPSFFLSLFYLTLYL